MKKRSTIAVLLFLALFSMKTFAVEYWVDVRTAEEYQQGNVDVAVNIPFDEIGEKISTVTNDKQAKIYLYCRSGGRAGKAQKTLVGLGYSNVENLGSLQQALDFKMDQKETAVK